MITVGCHEEPSWFRMLEKAFGCSHYDRHYFPFVLSVYNRSSFSAVPYFPFRVILAVHFHESEVIFVFPWWRWRKANNNRVILIRLVIVAYVNVDDVLASASEYVRMKAFFSDRADKRHDLQIKHTHPDLNQGKYPGSAITPLKESCASGVAGRECRTPDFCPTDMLTHLWRSTASRPPPSSGLPGIATAEAQAPTARTNRR